MKRFVTLASAAMLAAAPPAARAQLADAKVLTLQAAKTIIAAAEAEARKNNWNVSIAVVDAHGELLAFQRMDDAALTTVAIAQGKAQTAARYRRATKLIDSTVAAGRVQMMAFPGVMPIEGGVPISVNGKVIGGVGASGATSAQDAQVAKAGADTVRP
jgi:uncharacterized protein GlcG (DUF336 family)